MRPRKDAGIAPLPRAAIFSFGICVYPRGVAYDWNGGRTRRTEILKIGTSLMISSIAVTAPAMLLLKSND